ncbi:MAG: hypothetical protein COV48_14445, partial [Elusimicrobia bacterium CG11_big_fil_rev_8_21_14_0_20_64_6]
ILPPALAAALVRRAPVALLLMPFTRLKRPLFAFFSLTILAFIVWHLAPLIQIFAGPVIFKRMFSYQLPGLLSVLLYAWGVFLAVLLVWTSVRAWHDESLGFHERTLLLWPAAFAAVFILFRHTSSLRYYSLPALLCTVALAVLLPKIAAADRRGVYRCALAALFVTQAFLLPELAAPQDRRPLNFHVGWRKENSKDFARKEGLFAAYAASGACQVAHAERSFTAIPLYFHRAEAGEAPCDPALAFDSDQCPECASAPFYRWSIVPAPK